MNVQILEVVDSDVIHSINYIVQEKTQDSDKWETKSEFLCMGMQDSAQSRKAYEEARAELERLSNKFSRGAEHRLLCRSTETRSKDTLMVHNLKVNIL